ncbi:hypothetical protein DdX_09262 [Ditylenchus destructor]|uniref:G-protein coupled receptors family 1 profile domain-containing protein n=1 Tax=Ditylenchus destructor TaxID=166010 RepID=A0AAD4N6E4_9BILA|nr:hypothetical protein DdX_09262 [Ditylenchus destructor]
MEKTQSSVFKPPPYLRYFSLGDNIVIICFHSITISLMPHFLYSYYFKKTRLKVHTLSSSMLIFLWTHIICSIVDVPYHAYIVLKWNPAIQDSYDPYSLYWTGISVSVYYNLTSLSVLLLSLDRLLALKFPYRYKGRIEAWVPTVTILILVAFSIPPFALYFLALPLELEKVKYCQSQSCLLTRFNGTNTIQYMRLVTMAVNFWVSGYLLWIFRSVGNKEQLNNRAVKMTIILEILLNAIPSVASQICYTVLNFNFVNHVGPMQSVLITSNIALCAMYAWSIMVRRSRANVSPESTKIVAHIRPTKNVWNRQADSATAN